MGLGSEFNIYLFAKKIHRLLVWAVVIFGLLMMGTGLILKYPKFGEVLGLDWEPVRYLHNQLSTYFAIVLAIMILTGLVMYIYPLLKQRSNKQGQ